MTQNRIFPLKMLAQQNVALSFDATVGIKEGMWKTEDICCNGCFLLFNASLLFLFLFLLIHK